jgi:hypothetical protein
MGRMTASKEFPYVTPEGSDASMSIQWGSTSIYMEFDCQCGERSHGEGDSAFYVQCGACGAVYQMGLQVVVKRRPELQDSMRPGILLLEPDDDSKWKTDWSTPQGERTETLTFTVVKDQAESA